MAVNPQQLIVEIIKLVAGRPVCVAFSGGIDSHVLLHLLASSQHPQLPEIRAVHIDHGLNPHSTTWTKHCQIVAADLGIQLETIQVVVENIDELGLEAAARQARYHAFRFNLV